MIGKQFASCSEPVLLTFLMKAALVSVNWSGTEPVWFLGSVIGTTAAFAM